MLRAGRRLQARNGPAHSVEPCEGRLAAARLPACPAARSSFEVPFIDEAGGQCRELLPSCWDVRFERVSPARSFPSYKRQRNFPGLWWSATTGQHVAYESWVERDVAMLLDFDLEVVAFAAQPFWLIWPDQHGERKHAPDFFVRRADSTGVVIDVRPDELVDPEAAEVFAMTASACQQVGWEFRRTGGPPAVVAANLRWLAGYRHPRCRRPEIAAALAAGRRARPDQRDPPSPPAHRPQFRAARPARPWSPAACWAAQRPARAHS